MKRAKTSLLSIPRPRPFQQDLAVPVREPGFRMPHYIAAQGHGAVLQLFLDVTQEKIEAAIIPQAKPEAGPRAAPDSKTIKVINSTLGTPARRYPAPTAVPVNRPSRTG